MASLNAWALTTVADVKETLGIDSGDSSQNNLIIRKINQATDMIESYCGKNNSQHFASTTYTNEEYDGTGTNQLILKNRPVISISSFQQRSTTENISDWDDIDSELYFTDATAGVIDCLFGVLANWNMYRLTYVAGFTTIPSDLAEACATLAAYFVSNDPTGAAVKSKTQGPKKIEYAISLTERTVFEQLDLDFILQRYTDIPILADK